MAFKTWQTGVHIQQDRVLIVALVRERLSWCLRRWWAIPLTEGIILDGKICQPEQLFDALRGWRGGVRCRISTGCFSHFRRRVPCKDRCPARLSPCATANSSPG